MTATPVNEREERTPDPDKRAARAVVKSKSPTQLAMARFRKDKKSMVALIVVLGYFVAGIAAPILVALGVLDPYTTHLDLLGPDALPKGDWWGMSWDHPLGIEPGAGRDVLSRIWAGITFSLAVALAASIVAVGLGVVLGIIAGYAGGWIDAIIGRLTDLVLAFPQTLLLLAAAPIGIAVLTETLNVPTGAVAQGLFVVIVLGFFGWTGTTRLIRGQVLSLREREFVDAAMLFGASRRRIWFKELLPNLWAPVLVTFTLYMPAFISAEAALSYLGVSVRPPTPTLGNVLKDSLSYASGDFLYFFAPAFLIALIVVSFNLLGDGLRDALDPKGDR
ncbi:Binding-protein-dependent transport systems inner membrane component [metagenome]|uniref:Binding-protein-dependent transport systems inner membrane component n=1 Tax=metagenome TaxID=256318 RepID=A0A2P2BYA2_9ZZZZ